MLAPVRTNTFTRGSSYFNHPQWANYPARFYRLSGLTLGGLPALLWNPRVPVTGGRGIMKTNGRKLLGGASVFTLAIMLFAPKLTAAPPPFPGEEFEFNEEP